MLSAADETLPMLEALVEIEARRSGKRMNAYADVGRVIGATGSWVRKFLGGQPVMLDADKYKKTKAAWERECAKWEAEAELQKARFFALGREGHAMAQATTGTGQNSQANHDGEVARQGMEEGNGTSAAGLAGSALASLVDANRQ